MFIYPIFGKGFGWVTPAGSISDAQRGVPYSFQLQALGSNITYTLLSGTLPTGITLSPTGVLSGVTGDYTGTTFTVRISQASGAFSDRTFSLTSVAPGVYTNWDSLFKAPNSTLTNNNLTWTAPNSTQGIVISVVSRSTGKWYWEYHAENAEYLSLGITTKPTSSYASAGNPNSGATRDYHYLELGYVRSNNIGLVNLLPFADGDIISVALDLSNLKLHYAKNGVWTNSSDPATNTGGIAMQAGTYHATAGDRENSAFPRVTANFGATAFAYPVPTGFAYGLY